MQTSWLPQHTYDRIDRLTRDFIWKGNQGHDINLVGWDKITRGKAEGGLAIRISRTANTSMLGKLVWDLHSNRDKLWVHLVNQKYMRGSTILDVTKKNGSYTWNSIMKAREILKDGFEFRVGNGQSSLWYSNWFGCGLLARVVPFIDIHDSQLCIADVYYNSSWHLDLLYSFLPSNIIDHIKTLRLDLNHEVADGFIWKGNIDGTYTARAGYHWLLSLTQPANFPHALDSWNWIWKISGPEKIKLLIWLACHDALPTTALLAHRGMLESPSCQRCGSNEETVLHCLRDCPDAHNMWVALGFQTSTFFNVSNPFQWFKDATKGPHVHLFLASVWWLWRARNSACIAKEVIPVFVLQMAINNLASLILNMSSDGTTIPSLPRLVSWKPSRAYEVVLNVDGSSLGNPGLSGFGGLLRGTNGNWIAGFAGHIGISNNLHAELLGLQQGLRFAWNKGIRSLACYTDSTNVIQLVNSPLNHWNKYAPVIQNIKDLLSRDWVVLLDHMLREGNSCADFLAKLGATSTIPWILFDDPPADISLNLLADAAGVESVRE